MNKHIFSIAWHDLALFYNKEIIILKSKEHIQRILKTLRLREQESIIMFNRTTQMTGIIQSAHQKEVIIKVTEWRVLSRLKPTISLILPLLKKTAFEEALYNATEHGVSHFVFYISNKSQKNGDSMNKERIEKIIIAAAEQSRNYNYPLTKGPYLLNDALIASMLNQYECCILMDPEGSPIRASTFNHSSYGVLIGPEGGLENQEKSMIERSSFISMQLTPTILRASQAAGTAVGLIRSLCV